jgi:hypothetical protein
MVCDLEVMADKGQGTSDDADIKAEQQSGQCSEKTDKESDAFIRAFSFGRS